MKKTFFKKFISLAVVLTMVLSTCSIFVSAASKYDDKEYTIRVNETDRSHSFTQISKNRAYEGEIIELDVTIDEEYMLDYILISWYDNYGSRQKYLYLEDMLEEVRIREGFEGIWEFVMPEGPVNISIYTVEDWRNESFSINFNENELRNGELLSSKYRVKYGDEITITAIPDLGYAVGTLKVNRKELTPYKINVDGSAEYEYEVDLDRVDIKATFVKEERGVYPIYLDVEDGGKAVANKVTAKGGEEVTITVTPDNGMIVDSVLVDNIVTKGKDNKYTFTMSYYPVNVNVTFKKAPAGYTPSAPSVVPDKPSVNTWEKVGSYWKIKKTDGTYATGWQKMDGQWYYLDRAGDMLTGWQMLDGKWYFLKNSGNMATSWQIIGGSWFYFKGDGSMATGWALSGNKWYYFYSDGRMASSTTIGSYKLGADGAWIK